MFTNIAVKVLGWKGMNASQMFDFMGRIFLDKFIDWSRKFNWRKWVFFYLYLYISGLSADDDDIAGLVVSSMHFY